MDLIGGKHKRKADEGGADAREQRVDEALKEALAKSQKDAEENEALKAALAQSQKKRARLEHIIQGWRPTAVKKKREKTSETKSKCRICHIRDVYVNKGREWPSKYKKRWFLDHGSEFLHAKKGGLV